MQRMFIKKCFLFAVGNVSRIKQFTTGSKVTDNAQPGRPVEIATEATVQQLEELI
jgi:hypothetical protein